jgi:hypothetical protein
MEALNWSMHGLPYRNEKPADMNSNIILLNNIFWTQILYAFVSSLSNTHTLPNKFSYVHNFKGTDYALSSLPCHLSWYLS